MAKNLLLTRKQIDVAIAGLTKAVEKYNGLQAACRQVDIANDVEFQRKFNGYYRIRRGRKWRTAFYNLFEKAKGKQSAVGFRDVLVELHTVTERMEASFVSKLVETLSPGLPIIDSVVLKHLGLRLPWKGVEGRLAKIVSVYEQIAEEFDDYLKTENGKYLVDRFRLVYDAPNIKPVRMLDFVVWATRVP